MWRSDSDQGKYTLLKTTTDCSYTDTTAEGGKVYQYKVRCYWTIGGNAYYGTFSSPASVTTLPKKVSGIATQTRTETSLGLSWKQTQGAAGYQIYQYSAASDQYEMVADVEGESTSYTVSGLTGATEYKFKIRAYEKIMTMYWRAVFGCLQRCDTAGTGELDECFRNWDFFRETDVESSGRSNRIYDLPAGYSNRGIQTDCDGKKCPDAFLQRSETCCGKDLYI